MRKILVIVIAFLCASVSFAQGPGSEIRSGPGVVAPKAPPQRADAPQPSDTLQCESLRDEAKQRCMKEARDKTASAQRSGPESTGMGSGAGASGATGHGSPGSSAPR